MIAAVAAMLIPAAGFFAIAVMVLSALRYGPLVRALRRELATCSTTRELRFLVITTSVETADGLPALRPAEQRLAGYQPLHWQARRPALRAAA